MKKIFILYKENKVKKTFSKNMIITKSNFKKKMKNTLVWKELIHTSAKIYNNNTKSLHNGGVDIINNNNCFKVSSNF